MDLRVLRKFRRALPSGITLCDLPLVGPYFTYLKRISHNGIAEDVHHEGHRMYIDAMDSLNLSIEPIFEPLITQFIRATVRPGDAVVDIGANIGYYTLLLAKLTGPEGTVFAFEPEPENFSLLLRNIELNGYKNVIAAQKAIGATTGQAHLFLSDDNKGDHRIYGAGSRPSIPIEVTTLDNYFSTFHRPISLIKLDIQGAEPDAIKGMRSFLQKQKEVTLVTECWREGLEGGGVTVEGYLTLLRDVGFELSILTTEGLRRVVSNDEVYVEVEKRSRGFSVDLVGRKKLL